MSKTGILYPTVSAMSAGTPRDSAIANQESASKSQAQLINAVGGRRRYKSKKGGATVAVPQFQMSYQPTGGPGQNPNSVIKDNASVSTQSEANAVYDKYATQKGGKRRKRGGNPDWVWGCFSGGKKRTIKKRMSKRNRTRSKRKQRRTRKR